MVLAVAIVGMAGFLSSGVASADTVGEVFACADKTTSINRTTDRSNQLIVTCKSGANILYTNNSGYPTVTLDVSCPSGQSVGTAVDAPNAPTTKYKFYCVYMAGPDKPAVRSNVLPTSTDPVTNAAADAGYVDPAAKGGQCKSTAHCDLIDKYINPFINFMAALVGIAVVVSIIVGGIQYSSSAGDPQKVTLAKNRIRNAIIALVTFLFLYALLQFLVPGGIG